MNRQSQLAGKIAYLENELRGIKTSQSYVLNQVAYYEIPPISLSAYSFTTPGTQYTYYELAATFKFVGIDPSKTAIGIINSKTNNSKDLLFWKAFLHADKKNELRFGVVYYMGDNNNSVANIGITTNMNGTLSLERTYNLRLVN